MHSSRKEDPGSPPLSRCDEPVTVLVVDGDSQSRTRTADALCRDTDEVSVLTERLASDGLDRLETAAVDCIVSEYEMPGINGVEFLREVRANAGALPFVLFTTTDAEAVVDTALSLGATDFLHKNSPARYTLLRNRVHDAVTAHRADRQSRLREELRQTVSAVPESLVRFDANGELTYANARARELLGLERDGLTERTYNDPAWDIRDLDGTRIPDEELPFRRVLDSGEPVEAVRHSVVRPDGERRILEVTGTPLFDDTGAIEGAAFALTDVTGQFEYERELERYETFLTHSPTSALFVDGTGAVEYLSPVPDEFEPFVPERLFDDVAPEHIHPDDETEVIANFERVLDSDPEAVVQFEFRIRTTGEEYRWIEARAVNHLGTDPVDGVLVVTRDITERKRSEQELADYAQTLTQLQQTTDRLLRATTPDEAATAVLDSLEDAFAFDVAGVWLANEDRTRLDPVGVTDRGEQLVDSLPTYSLETESLSWRAFDAQETRVVDDPTAHETVHNPDTHIGSELIVPLGEYGLLNVGSEEPAAFDERDREQVAVWGNTVASALARLEQVRHLRDREAELKEERNRLDEFASFVSHDLRNPLNVATLRHDLATRECDSPHLAALGDALDRMEQLIDDLLTLSREGAAVGETEVVSLADLARQCERTVNRDGLTLSVETDAAIRADRSRLASALENLLQNADEHGGDRVTVTVGWLERGDGFYLADDGAGIAASERDQVFGAGYSTDDTGTGLGLHIVGQVVEAHGWDIHVTESAAGGARFEVTGVDRPSTQ